MCGGWGGGGGSTGRSEVETLSISALVFTVWGTNVSAEGVTLFSNGSGTGHHGGGHHSYNIGVLGHLVSAVIAWWLQSTSAQNSAPSC